MPDPSWPDPEPRTSWPELNPGTSWPELDPESSWPDPDPESSWPDPDPESSWLDPDSGPSRPDLRPSWPEPGSGSSWADPWAPPVTLPPDESAQRPAVPDRPVSRRRFLMAGGAVVAAGVGAGLLARSVTADGTRPASAVSRVPAGPSPVPTKGGGNGTLVLITLYGGNDGLNTVIPVTDPAYRAGRPTLGYQPNEVLTLADGLGLNPKLPGMKSLWDAGHLAVVRGVGYPSPSLSHFQSMDIWQTADLSASGSGWLGRWLDATGTDPMRALSIGALLPPALRGERTAATALTSSTITLPGGPALTHAYAGLVAPTPAVTGLAAAIAGTGTDLLSVEGDLNRLHPAAAGGVAGGGVHGGGVAGGKRAGTSASFAGQLQLVAGLIRAGAPTRVYQVSLSSFDTHADEKATHERMLAELDSGLSGFFTSLAGTPAAEGVVCLTVSEFGRRVAENASGGTDHGTASPLFVAGTGVKGGKFYGEEPSLTDLDAGDLRFNVDFRSVYATVLDRVIGVDPRSVLRASFPTLEFL